MSFELATWLVSFLALAGTILNSNRNKYGFLIWIFTNLFWLVVDFRAGLYAQSALYGAYVFLAIRGLLTWTKKEKKDME